MKKYVLGLMILLVIVSVSGCTSSDSNSTKSIAAKSPLTLEEATNAIKQDINRKHNQSDQYTAKLVPGSVKILNATSTETTVTYEQRITYTDGEITTYSAQTKFYTNENGEWILNSLPM